MAAPNARAKWILGLRLGLGLLLAATGLAKLLDVAGFIGVIDTYQLRLGPLGTSMAAWATVAVELLLGAWLLVSRRPHLAAVLAAIVNLGYAVLLTHALMRGLRLSNCGCFGVFFPSPLTWLSPLESTATAGLCFLLWFLLRKMPER